MKQKEILKPELFVAGSVRNNYKAVFKVGVQSFFISESTTKTHAKWCCKMFKIAMKNAGISITISKDQKHLYEYK